ncbi:MAG: tRNA pseudouridine(55) synthase TruB [Rhodospirillaceae bacterium]|nr:tRNA pseudouridine(55) synthase TruB [Rhodospirillaceae bacterium]
MARVKKGVPVHGWLIIDKPLGLSSSSVVGIVKRALNAQKAGHAGTLDPLASGVLPIALGEATKTVSFVMDGAKAYRFTVKWGSATNTDDAEGEVIKTSDKRPSAEEIEKSLPQFIGRITQVPPAYSAIKIGGQRAYKLARGGEMVEMAPREVIIDDFKLVSAPDPDSATFEVSCQKGTYIRALARDLALSLGTCGHVSYLRRTKSGPFVEKDAISLDSQGSLGHSAALETGLMPIETALDDIPALALTENEASSMRQGGFVDLDLVLEQNPEHNAVKGVVEGGTVLVMSNGKPVALARIASKQLRPVRVFNI